MKLIIQGILILIIIGKIYNSGWLGINSNDPRNFSFLTNDANIAKKINVGGLLVSDSYSNETYVPANGIWSKGNIQSNSKVVSSREGFLEIMIILKHKVFGV
ncbi:hypothetical protein [Chryseobacterium indoltheticum]|uniref:hypothetical protein n=1 Tax=Chryseobacterium indoltheticum TaxID=254 RepID=UPI003F4915C0